MQEGMSLPKYESNRGTTHFARIAWAILGPCMDVLREVLAKEISPPVLEKKVKDYISENRKPSISEKQKQLVYNKKYSDFDITLLYFLFRNICSISQHENKWGKDPKPTDKGVSANIERVRILRNEWYGHATDFSLSDSDFKQKWTYISQIVKELECYLGTGTKYQDTLIKLKTCFMDPESIERYIDTLSTDITYLKEGFGELQTNVTNIKEGVGELQTNVTNIKESFGEFQTDVTSLKEGFGELQTDVTNIKEDFGELQTDVTNIKESFGEFQTDVTSLKESPMEKSIFNQWGQDDSCFISTKACKEVEKMIKSRNLVIVSGHSGSGKSAIIQHIALQYREQGWTVRRVKEVKDIVDEYNSSQFQKNKTICVFNDPLGKESFDEILNNSWQTHKEDLELYLKAAKLVMSCRSHIICDTRLTRYLANQSNVVNIDDKETKLSVQEKRQILTKYTSNVNLSDEDCRKILEVETYFPLLCKLYSSKEEYKNKSIEFFTEPVTVLKEEILGFRKKDKGKYCALALLVFFNDSLCARDFLKDKDTENKFKHTLKICGLSKKTAPSEIRDNLNSLKSFFVKEVGDTYHFFHDLVMEVTTYVLGTDYPTEIIKYADIGFLRRRVELGNSEKHNDSFTIFLNDKYKNELGERFLTELTGGERILDVVLNPCLRNEIVIKIMENKIAAHPEYLQMLLETKKLEVDKKEFHRTSEKLLLTKLSILNLEKEVSPLFALIVFCHTQLSQYCVNTLQQKQMCFLISAICCNGSIELFFNVFKDHGEETLEKTWGGLCPIHIVSMFHNYKLLSELIKIGLKVNQKTDDYGGWTPLLLAASYNTENGYYSHRESGAERRDETVKLLLSNGADINLCNEDGTSPLFIACQNGHFNTVQLLLSNGADINLCQGIEASPLYIACQNGHDSTVQLLLSNGADIQLCMEDGASSLCSACHNGHDSTVQLLLSNGADINLCMEDGASPLFIACQNGHDSTVQLLLSNGADIQLCMEDGAGPLLIACENGHDSTVQLLLSNGADINLCDEDGTSPLLIACLNERDSTVQLLLSNGADINLCTKDRVSPIIYAFVNRQYETVNILLNNGADSSLACGWEVNPALVDCFDKQDCTVVFLQQKDNISNNLYDPDSYFSLFVSCQVERAERMIFLEGV